MRSRRGWPGCAGLPPGTGEANPPGPSNLPLPIQRDGGRVDDVAQAGGLGRGRWAGQGSAVLGCDIAFRAVMTECLRVTMPEALPLHTLGAGDFWILPKKNGEVILAKYGAADFVDRPNFDASLTEEVKLEIVKGVAQILPALEKATIVEHRGDLLAMAPTPTYQQPVMGRVPNWQKAYVAARDGRDGICMSPATGTLED